MSLYSTMVCIPLSIEVKDGAKEVIFYTVSCMCDNKHKIALKDTGEGFEASGCGNSLSNWQMSGDYKTDMEWAADDGDWDEVARVINSGTEKIYNIRSR